MTYVGQPSGFINHGMANYVAVEDARVRRERARAQEDRRRAEVKRIGAEVRLRAEYARQRAELARRARARKPTASRGSAPAGMINIRQAAELAERQGIVCPCDLVHLAKRGLIETRGKWASREDVERALRTLR